MKIYKEKSKQNRKLKVYKAKQPFVANVRTLTLCVTSRRYGATVLLGPISFKSLLFHMIQVQKKMTQNIST